MKYYSRENTKKEYTEQDLEDAFQWGYNFAHKRIETKFKYIFFKEEKDPMYNGPDVIEEAIEKMIKEKKGDLSTI